MLNLKERRNELGLTMLEVAEQVGVSEATISRYESGNIKNMKSDRIKKYAKALQVSPSEFLEIDDDYINNELKLEKELINSILNYYSETTFSDFQKIETSSKNTDKETLNKIKMFFSKFIRKDSEILTYYEQLNDLGQQEAIKRVKELTYLPDYKK